MQSRVDLFIIFDVDFYRARITEMLIFHRLKRLKVGRKLVVRLAGRYAKGEFAAVVGIGFPASFLHSGPAQLNVDSVNGMTVRVPDCTEDHSIGGRFVGRWRIGLLGCFLSDGGTQRKAEGQRQALTQPTLP